MNYFNRAINLMSIAIALSSFALTTACSQSEFAGDSSPPKADATKKPRPKPCQGPGCNPTTTTVDTPDGPNDSISTDNGGISAICDPAAMVSDPNATEVISGRANVVTFVNSICGEKLTNNYNGAGALHFDTSTANAICRFKGFLKSSGVTKGKYFSCGDNKIGKWAGLDPGTLAPFDPLSGSITVQGACAGNETIESLTCIGKVQAACVPKTQSIVCK